MFNDASVDTQLLYLLVYKGYNQEIYTIISPNGKISNIMMMYMNILICQKM